MNRDNCLANASSEIASAEDAVRVARAALALGAVRDALSRAYYAAFHAARALVLLQGLEPKTHGGLSRLFNEHVIRSGQLEPRFNLVLSRLQSYRQSSDYAYDFAVSAEDAAHEIDAAAELLERARALVEAARTA